MKTSRESKNRAIRSAWGLLFLGMLVAAAIAPVACTGHDNPFDPDNSKTGGEPFNLRAYNGYGKIELEWDFPKIGQDKIEIDSFFVLRTGPEQTTDTLRFGILTSLTDSFNLGGDTTYTYQVMAVDGVRESDLSNDSSAVAYSLPLRGEDILNGRDFSQAKAVAFDKRVKFISLSGGIRVVDGDMLGPWGDAYTPIDDMAVLRSISGESTFVAVCSEQNNKAEIFSWAAGSLRQIAEIDITAPRAIVSDHSSNRFLIATNDSRIHEIRRGQWEPRVTGMRTENDPVDLAIFSPSNRLFCANQGSDIVSAFDLRDGKLLDTIRVSSEPVALWVGPDSCLYVACKNAATVDVIDPSALKNLREIAIQDPKNTTPYMPVGVSGFADSLQRHAGVLAVLSKGDNRSFVQYYSLEDRKLQWSIGLRQDAEPRGITMNEFERSLYIAVGNRVRKYEMKLR